MFVVGEETNPLQRIMTFDAVVKLTGWHYAVNSWYNEDTIKKPILIAGDEPSTRSCRIKVPPIQTVLQILLSFFLFSDSYYQALIRSIIVNAEGEGLKHQIRLLLFKWVKDVRKAPNTWGHDIAICKLLGNLQIQGTKQEGNECATTETYIYDLDVIFIFQIWRASAML